MKFEEAVEKLSLEAKKQLKDSSSLEDILAIFSKNGLQVAKEDILEAINKKSGELSDDELAGVTGGIDVTTIIQDIFKMIADKYNNKGILKN